VNTLNLKQAAELLHMGESTVRERASAGDIPAAKPGKEWVFVDVDLIEWLRSQYGKCRSSKETKSTITILSSKGKGSEDRWELPPRKKQPGSTTISGQKHGPSQKNLNVTRLGTR